MCGNFKMTSLSSKSLRKLPIRTLPTIARSPWRRVIRSLRQFVILDINYDSLHSYLQQKVESIHRHKRRQKYTFNMDSAIIIRGQLARDEKRKYRLEVRITSPIVNNEEWRTNPFHGYNDFLDEQATQHAFPPVLNSEVDQWLSRPPLSLDSTPDIVKVYMQSKVYEFPIITQIARDYLAIPATPAPSKRVFSVAGNLISKKRTRIASENVRYVLCLRALALLVQDDDEVQALIDEERQIIETVRPVVQVVV
jgi:hypothetical protein